MTRKFLSLCILSNYLVGTLLQRLISGGYGVYEPGQGACWLAKAFKTVVLLCNIYALVNIGALLQIARCILAPLLQFVIDGSQTLLQVVLSTECRRGEKRRRISTISCLLHFGRSDHFEWYNQDMQQISSSSVQDRPDEMTDR